MSYIELQRKNHEARQAKLNNVVFKWCLYCNNTMETFYGDRSTFVCDECVAENRTEYKYKAEQEKLGKADDLFYSMQAEENAIERHKRSR